MSAQRCLVTGGAGFIGSHVVDLLLERGHPVAVIDDLSTGRAENVDPKARLPRLDVRDLAAIRPVIRNCDWIFHGAALPRIQPSFDEPRVHEDVNVGGTINCLIAAREAGVKRFLYFGSSAVYGTPDVVPTPEDAAIRCYNPYALQKYAAEQYALMLGKRWGVPVVSLRLFNVYGPRSFYVQSSNSAYSPVIGVFHHQRQRGMPLTITGSGEQSRDFIHVHDVAEAFLVAARSDVADEVLNVGMGESHSINAVADMMSEQRVHIPARPNEAVVTQADIGKAQRLLNWAPAITLSEGLRRLDE